MKNKKNYKKIQSGWRKEIRETTTPESVDSNVDTDFNVESNTLSAMESGAVAGRPLSRRISITHFWVSSNLPLYSSSHAPSPRVVFKLKETPLPKDFAIKIFIIDLGFWNRAPWGSINFFEFVFVLSRTEFEFFFFSSEIKKGEHWNVTCMFKFYSKRSSALCEVDEKLWAEKKELGVSLFGPKKEVYKSDK